MRASAWRTWSSSPTKPRTARSTWSSKSGAAHRTHDARRRATAGGVERGVDRAELACRGTVPERVHDFLERARSDADRVRRFLSQMLLAQGYQDLTGQIIRGVIALVGELETVLGQLVALANGDDTRRMPALTCRSRSRNVQRGVGPQVPGHRPTRRGRRPGRHRRVARQHGGWPRSARGHTFRHRFRARAGRGAGGRRAQGRGHSCVAVGRGVHDRRGGHLRRRFSSRRRCRCSSTP